MKTNFNKPIITLALLALAILSTSLSTVFAQGTAFTYQGQLTTSNGPASGTYNFTFALYNTNTSGTAVAGPVTNNAVAVANGLFTVAIDFGSGPWNGETNWLEIAVETNGATTFTNLSPRQQLTPVPYAIYAESGSATALASGTALGSGVGNSIATGAGSSFVGGGTSNQILGGLGFFSTNNAIAGGLNNLISYNDFFDDIGGGEGNVIGSNDIECVIGGGSFNTIGPESVDSTIPGGSLNTVSGFNSFAAGEDAQANNNNTFAWSDGTGLTTSSANKQFLARASGGYVLLSSAASPTNLTIVISAAGEAGDNLTFEVENAANNNPLALTSFVTTNGSGANSATNLAMAINIPPFAALGISAVASGRDIIVSSPTEWQNEIPIVSVVAGGGGPFTMALNGYITQTGVTLPAGGGAWNMMSDRRAKANFAAIDPQAVLSAVAAIPVTTWNYKTQDKSIRHIGPMAQDFHAAFGVGENDTTISIVDEEGVALAAIQGLNQKLEEKNSEIQDLKKQNDSMAQQLNKLEATVKALAAQK